ncbi:MAG: hypothetical protein CVU90_13260 [Firmicutes bacterium HGW-Firmicutes-15]|nr:MAG: hypothetical protein CVU90_13260 [Firmicutes bacterium HGW-Firmicutes-15]
MKNPRYYPHERNRYFYGKLLTVRDFESEQKYCNDKRRMGNRVLHGAGVVCGLQVVAVDDKTISVETGMAIDYSGREIVVASPVTQKLSMIDGFGNNDYAKNIYLCIAYDERGKEPVYSVASSSTRAEEVGEHNRMQEIYHLFVREDAPDPANFGFSRLFENTTLLYSDEQLRIWQRCPNYVNPNDLFEITLLVEKTLQVPRVTVEYELGGGYIYGVDGELGGKIYFQEPEHDRESSYEVSFPFRAGAVAGMVDEVVIKQGRMRIQLGERVLEPEADCSQVLQIVAEPVRERILQDYLNLSLDQYLEKEDQAIYLARISIMQIGPSFMIEKVEQLPFKEYAYNLSDLYKLGVLGQGRAQGPYLTKASAYFTEAEEEPRLDVRYQPDKNQFDFDLGIPRPRVIAGADSTGVVEFDLEVTPRAAKSYFSDEIDHGLGTGLVHIITGVEESTEEEVLRSPQHCEQIFFGDYDIFQKSEYESLAPRMDIGTVLYPERGSFRIGIRCQTPSVTKVRIRWWVYKKA